MLMFQGTFKASFDQPLTGSGNGIDAGVQRGGDLTVAPSFTGVRGIRLQQNACPEQLSRGVPALIDCRNQLLTFLVAELHDVFFLTAISFLVTNPLRCRGRDHRVRDWPRNQGRGALDFRLTPEEIAKSALILLSRKTALGPNP